MTLLLLAALLAGCTNAVPPQPTLPPERNGTAPEQPIVRLPLMGPAASTSAEMSGMAWYGEQLVLLPQYPQRGAPPGGQQLYALPKSDILTFLDTSTTRPLLPRPVPLVTNGVEGQIPYFQGYEAIAFQGNQVYLTIEAGLRQMMGYIVRGSVAANLSEIRLDPTTLRPLYPPTNIHNAAYEALLVAGDTVLSFYEANGANVNPQPTARVFGPDMVEQPPVPFPTLEYRVTDATPVDSQGKFWVANRMYSGSRNDYQPAPDGVALRHGTGPSHARSSEVERLVELHYGPNGITLTDTPPIQLELTETDGRNWEGIARLDQRGFLLISDKFPETMLAFVAQP
ncbi:MAG: hypothetical protein MUD01_18070 [Chloroflexaceae bacterium]|jgi:hypothetical protein|nr:hypothetical protein [Chloroflexaceae bacterium]